MIKIRRNCKKIERSSKARKKLWLRNFAAKRGPLRKSHFTTKNFCSPQEPLRKFLFPLRKSISTAKLFRSRFTPVAKIFAAAKALLGTWVPFCSRVPPFCSCELAATFSTPGDPPFRSRGTISKGVSQLRNPSLAHERHFAKSYARFATAKWDAKSMPNFSLLRKRLAAAKSAPPHCEKTPLLRKGTVTFGVLFKRYKFHFSYF